MIAEGGGQQSEDLHRDYFDASGDIMVEVFKNQLLISNPGWTGFYPVYLLGKETDI